MWEAIGRKVGRKAGEAYWTGIALTGSGAKAREAEYILGRQLARAFQPQVVSDPALDSLLLEIGTRLTEELASPDWRFRFQLWAASEMNGFALPGGFIFLTPSLLEFCQHQPDEIAFVLGHEIGHVVKRHSIDRYRSNMALRVIVSRLMPQVGPVTEPLSQAALQLLEQTYSQDKELEADKFGVRILRQAGFQPRNAIQLLERFFARTPAPSLLDQYFSSHPPFEKRLAQLERLL